MDIVPHRKNKNIDIPVSKHVERNIELLTSYIERVLLPSTGIPVFLGLRTLAKNILPVHYWGYELYLLIGPTGIYKLPIDLMLRTYVN